MDTVTFNSRINSSVLPSTNGTLDLGGSSNKWNNVYANTFNGQFIGNADTATKLLNARNFSITGDVDASVVSFDGTGNVNLVTTLDNSGVVANTYGSSTTVPVFAVDAKGRVTSVTNTGINFSTATVSQSDTVKTLTSSTNASFYPTFVDSDNNPAAYEALYTDAGISYNPSTNLLSLTDLTVSNTSTFNGNVTLGDASSDTVTFNSRINSSVLPSTNGTLDLGGSSNKWNNVYANTFVGAITGNSDTATKLATARNIAITGDLSWNVNFDGSANVTSTGTLANSGVTASTYGSSTTVPVFAVDAKGRVTSVTNTGINFSTATVSQSDTIKTVSSSASLLYPTFVDSNNSPAAYEALYTDADISYNASTNLLTVSNIKPSGIQDSSGATGTNNYVLTANGSGGWTWKIASTSGGSAAIGGITVQEEGTLVGTALGTQIVNFVGNSVTATSPTSGTATITISDVTVTQDSYACTNPITTSGSTITIGTLSNAYGRKFVQTTEPIGACDGDIWYDTSGTSSGGFPSGTLMLFQQTSAPTGWTKQTTHNDKALRVVSGTASSGGTTAFSSVMASRTPAGTVSGSNSGGAVSNHTLVTSQIPSHVHPITTAGFSGGGSQGAGFPYNTQSTIPLGAQNSQAAGGGGAHNHGFTNPSWSGSFSGSALDFAVQYVDLIIASKDP